MQYGERHSLWVVMAAMAAVLSIKAPFFASDMAFSADKAMGHSGVWRSRSVLMRGACLFIRAFGCGRSAAQ